MSKTEIKQQLKDNYIDRLKRHVAGMQKQGYLLAQDNMDENIYLMRFNLQRFKFDVVASLGQAHKHIDISKVQNSFKIVLDNGEYVNILTDGFPIVDSDDLYAYVQYEEMVENVKPKSEMEADLKSYLKLSEKLAGDITKEMQDTPQAQAQLLAKSNVFYTGRDNSLSITECNKYFQWDNKAKSFQLLTSDGIGRLISDVTGEDAPKKMEIETNMRTVYPVIVTNTPFPVQWNKQKDLQKKIKQAKKGHDKIAKIVKNFE